MTNSSSQEDSLITRIQTVKGEVASAMVIFILLLISFKFRLEIKNILKLNNHVILFFLIELTCSYMAFMYFYLADKIAVAIFENFEKFISQLWRNLLFGFFLSFYSVLFSGNYPVRTNVLIVVLISIAYFCIIPLILMLTNRIYQKGEIMSGEKRTLPKKQKKRDDNNLFLKWFIIILGFILLAFIGFFTYKMYSATSISVTANITQPVITSNAESQALLRALDSRISTIESNVNLQLESYAANTSFVNQQVSTLYSMFNNSLMIFTIILGFFTLIIAVFGFYISNVINHRYKLIKKSQHIINESKKKVIKIETKANQTLKKINTEVTNMDNALANKGNELFERFVEFDNSRMLDALKDDPLNISNIFNRLAYQKDLGENTWQVIRNAFLNYISTYMKGSSPNLNYYLVMYVCTIFQHYSNKIAEGKDSDLIDALYKYRHNVNNSNFFIGEIIKFINIFKDVNDEKILTIFMDIIVKGYACFSFLNNEDTKLLIINELKIAISVNMSIKQSLSDYVNDIEKINNQNNQKNQLMCNVEKSFKEALGIKYKQNC